ncbi:hypothetical protein KVH27_14075 [Streptomyces olivaceus]|uniref:hypothetical protein n=1 Tax=Streptomyces olivaceus TaxID=47716 RepID=UPI001CD00927|nr:hypothetical protein [Streptomyces olivaceus]MBZ6249517.1 hypothetical protein [Streptomyces olivaceus]
MTRTAFVDITLFWGCWTLFESAWVALRWQDRSRVLGRGVYRVRGVSRLGRRSLEFRVDAVLAALADSGVRQRHVPSRDQLVERWHRMVVGRFVAALLQSVPVLIIAVPLCWMSFTGAPREAAPLWMFMAVAAFAAVSLSLMAVDQRAVGVSDPAGVVTVEAVRFLETLLRPETRLAQECALDVHTRSFGRLCRALRSQARYGARTMWPTDRARLGRETERLIAVLEDRGHTVLFSEREERGVVVGELTRVVASTLQHSCRPRAERDDLVVVDGELLTDTLTEEPASTASNPLGVRLLHAVGSAALGAALVTVAVLLPDGAVASEPLTWAGLAAVASISPPMRRALNWVKERAAGVGVAEASAEPCRHPNEPSITS